MLWAQANSAPFLATEVLSFLLGRDRWTLGRPLERRDVCGRCTLMRFTRLSGEREIVCVEAERPSPAQFSQVSP